MAKTQQGSTKSREAYIGGILAMLLLASASCVLQMTHGKSLIGAGMISFALAILRFCVTRARISGLLVSQLGSFAAFTYGIWNFTIGATLLCIGGRIFDNAGNGFSIGSSIAGGFFLLLGGWTVVQGGFRLGEIGLPTRHLAT